MLLIGDFNARTSKLDDFISNKGNQHLPDHTQDNTNEKTREHFDSITNNHGKNLIQICKSCDLRILNGRTKGDSLGKPTFHGMRGRSVIDYAICNTSLMKSINSFIVKPPSYLSDHSQITTWINTKKTIDTFHSNNTCNPNFSHKLPNQFIWDNNFFRTYTDCLRSPNIQQKIQNFLINEYSTNSDGINNCLNDFEDIILEAGMKSLKIKKVTRHREIRNTTNKKWFDKECRFKRHTVRKIENKKHKDPQNLNLRNSYHEVLKDYKNTLRLKKDEFYQQKLNEL